MGTNKDEFAFNFFVDNPEEIKQGTQQMVRTLTECITESDYIKINKLLLASKQMRYSIQGYEEEANISEEIKTMLLNAGYASALLDVMQLYTEKMNAKNEILKINTKYRDMILRILAKRGTLLHRDLASALGVSASGLNAIIKQMNGSSVKLINVEMISKYTLYSITPVAYKYIIKKEQEYFPRESRKTVKQRHSGYSMTTSRYGAQSFHVEPDNEWREAEEIERLEIFKAVQKATPKYGNKAIVEKPILKYERRLA